jgi:hypothetical protein
MRRPSGHFSAKAAASTSCKEGEATPAIPPAFTSTHLLHLAIIQSNSQLGNGDVPIDKWVACQEESVSHQDKDAAMPSLPAPVRQARASTATHQVTHLLKPRVSSAPANAPPAEHTPKKSRLSATSAPRPSLEATSLCATSASSTPETTQKQERRISTAGNLTRAMHARPHLPSRIPWRSHRSRYIR